MLANELFSTMPSSSNMLSTELLIQQYKFNLRNAWFFGHVSEELTREDIMTRMHVLYFLARHKCAMGCKPLLKLKHCGWPALHLK